MENITIGQILAVITCILAVIKGVGEIKKVVTDAIGNLIEPVNKKLDAIDKKIDSVDMSAGKNYLATRFAELRQGAEFDETTKARVYEVMDHYTALGGNSYIKKEFEDLKAQNKL